MRHDRIDPAAARRASEAVPSIPCDAEGPVFREPWEAQAFAMTLALHDRGLFTWPEWAATLGDEIKKAQAAGDPDTGETYYRHWLAALERIVAEKGVTDAATLRALLRRLGPRRRPHAARHADRAEAGRFPLETRSGVLDVLGPDAEAEDPRRNAAQHREPRAAAARTAASSSLVARQRVADQQLVLHDHLHALDDPRRKFAARLHRGQMRPSSTAPARSGSARMLAAATASCTAS